jgi:hypothetical protein
VPPEAFAFTSVLLPICVLTLLAPVNYRVLIPTSADLTTVYMQMPGLAAASSLNVSLHFEASLRGGLTRIELDAYQGTRTGGYWF